MAGNQGQYLLIVGNLSGARLGGPVTSWRGVDNLRLLNLRPAARPKESTYLGCCLKLSEVWFPIP